MLALSWKKRKGLFLNDHPLLPRTLQPVATPGAGSPKEGISGSTLWSEEGGRPTGARWYLGDLDGCGYGYGDINPEFNLAKRDSWRRLGYEPK